MFRRLPNKLPPDVTFPANLKELGYFVTDNDQIRQIAHPDRKYQYKINRNDRINDVYKEAMNSGCSLTVVQDPNANRHGKPAIVASSSSVS